MMSEGIRASELIKQLKQLIKQHGDKEVFAGGEDYPNGVRGVVFEQTGDSYTPSDSFRIWISNF